MKIRMNGYGIQTLWFEVNTIRRGATLQQLFAVTTRMRTPKQSNSVLLISRFEKSLTSQSENAWDKPEDPSYLLPVGSTNKIGRRRHR